jgi:hypothetical protein
MPQPKYKMGQKVQIIHIKDRNGKAKYPFIEKAVGKTGNIVDCAYFGAGNIPNVKSNPYESVSIYIYSVSIDGETVSSIPEFALGSV